VRVAVTGATGFIGGAVVRRLVAAGHDVLALGRAAQGPAGVDYGRWDLGTNAEAPAGLGGCDAVVHAAAHVAAWGDERVFRAVTVDGTARLIDAIDARARLVVVGSSSVYCPDGRRGTYRESDAPVDASRYRGAYPRAKAAQERLVAARRPDAVVLRARAVWGPGDRTLLPRLEARTRGGRLVLPDGGRHPMSTTHVESLLDAVEAALRHPAVAGPVNVADATPRSAAELLEALFAARGRPLRIVPVPGRLTDVLARAVEAAWRHARVEREPPLTRYAVAQLAAPIVLDLGRLHRDLGIRPDADVSQRARELAGEGGSRTP
jgi:nucleoside-diphosphate-sugar epimerase